jgi:hypothetical protein
VWATTFFPLADTRSQQLQHAVFALSVLVVSQPSFSRCSTSFSSINPAKVGHRKMGLRYARPFVPKATNGRA